jgi:hypothetical protein
MKPVWHFYFQRILLVAAMLVAFSGAGSLAAETEAPMMFTANSKFYELKTPALGLRARSGFEVDIDWAGGKLEKAAIKSLLGNPCIVRYQGKTHELQINKGEAVDWSPDNNKISSR